MENAMTYQKSKHTLFLEGIDCLRQLEFDQYRATAFMFDAVLGSNDLEKLQYKTLRGAKGAIQKAFGTPTLMDYVLSKDLEEIPAVLCGPGDFLVVTDDPHDDIAFNCGRKWVFFNDNGIQLDALDIKTVPLEDHNKVRAFRLS